MSRLTSFSQPLPALPSQSAKFSEQVKPHWASMQKASLFSEGQGLASQAPQLSTLVLVFTSQPFAGLPSQSANGRVQLSTWHTPPAQAAVALSSEQAVPQSPQLS